MLLFTLALAVLLTIAGVNADTCYATQCEIWYEGVYGSPAESIWAAEAQIDAWVTAAGVRLVEKPKNWSWDEPMQVAAGGMYGVFKVHGTKLDHFTATVGRKSLESKGKVLLNIPCGRAVTPAIAVEQFAC